MKNKTLLFFIILMLSAFLLAACSDCDNCGCDCGGSNASGWLSGNHKVYGSGDVTREVYEVEGATEVILSEEGDLYVEIGDHNELIIEAEDNFQKYLTADVDEKGVLEIRKLRENVTLNGTQPIRYYLTLTNLEYLKIKNSGDAKVSGLISSEVLVIQISGSGSIYLDSIEVEELNIELTSSGCLFIEEGKATTQNIRLSSSGEYDGSNVKGEMAIVHVSSSGSVTLGVVDFIEVDLSSSGNVFYTGDPNVEILDMSSSGGVEKVP